MRALRIICMGALLAAPACSKSKDQAADKPAEQPAAAAAVTTPPAPAADSEEAKKKEQIERVAKALEKAKADAAEAAKRWTDELRKSTVALSEAEYPDAKAALTAILASPHRAPGHADRDQYRHPLETLTFFGIRQDMTVLEVGAGGGWYTEILAPLLAKKGKLMLAVVSHEGAPEEMSQVYGTRIKLFLEAAPEVFGKVERVIVAPPDKLALGAPGSVDMAIVIREMHGWQRRGYLKQYATAIHEVLKPGGVLGVVQHRAKPDAKPEESAEKGYLPEEWLIKELESVGFKLAERSEINANPKDTKDYEGGVWTLPPNTRGDDKDRDKYLAIGESDRMTLKFVKPAVE